MQDYNNNEVSKGMRAVCFLLPIIALVMYFANIKSNPEKAKTCCKFGAIGIWAGIIGGFVIMILCALS